MSSDTTFFVFNENGFIDDQKLDSFCKNFIDNTSFQFRKFDKQDIDLASTIYKKFSSDKLEYIIYDHGYVMRIEGEIKESILLLKELDKIIDNDTVYFVSPSQRVVNSNEKEYPRGADEKEIAQFLDRLFNNNIYTSVYTDN